MKKKLPLSEEEIKILKKAKKIIEKIWNAATSLPVTDLDLDINEKDLSTFEGYSTWILKKTGVNLGEMMNIETPEFKSPIVYFGDDRAY